MSRLLSHPVGIIAPSTVVVRTTDSGTNNRNVNLGEPLPRALTGGQATTHPTLSLSRRSLSAVAVATAALLIADVQFPVSAQAAIYLFGMVALNLPHGGYEHFTNLRRRAARFRLWYLGAYLALVGAFLGLFFLAPPVGLTLAVVVACVKGGVGGLHALDATSGTDHLPSR